eukprot:gene17421-23723_t
MFLRRVSHLHATCKYLLPLTSNTPSYTRWEKKAELFGDQIALEDPHRFPGKNLTVTYKEMFNQMKQLAAGLQSLGIKKGSRVGLFSENSSRWIVTDQAVMMCGAVAAVRGSTAPLEELAYIANHSESEALLLMDLGALKKMAPELKKNTKLKCVMVMWADAEALKKEIEAQGLPSSLKVVRFEEVMALGEDKLKDFKVVQSSPDELATLCYTSGTTGHPKAVMLMHSNLMYQIKNLRYFVPVEKGETSMSLLPPWHIYERSCGYFMFSHGLRVVFTSIPRFSQDLAKYTPNHFVSVPLVLDTLHSRVMKKLKAMPAPRMKIAMMLVAASLAYVRAKRVVDGTALAHAMKHSARTVGTFMVAWLTVAFLTPVYSLAQKMVFTKVKEAVGVKNNIVCGGGSLAPHLDDFFEACGINLLNGWGLTESSPNIRGSTGLPTPGTTLRVVDPETLVDLPDGIRGLILANGPGIMSGYLKDDAATAKAFRAGPGWFDTGDLGFRVAFDVPGAENMAGHIVLTGRAKDTIIMSNGKNVEPEPIENAIASSPLVKHVIIIGQDKRELGAFVFPDFDALEDLAKADAAAAAVNAPATPATAAASSTEELQHAPHSPEELVEMYMKEVKKKNQSRPDYHPHEAITHITVMDRPLSVDEGTLTRTMKPMRPEIYKVYVKEVAALEKKLR